MFWIVNPSQMASHIPKLSIAVFSSGPGQYVQWLSHSNVSLIFAAANNDIYLTCFTKASFYKLRLVPKRAKLYTIHFIPSK